MEAQWQTLPPNPKENANIFSSLFFFWTLPLFRKGLHKNLEIEDLYTTLKKDKSDSLGDILEKHYLEEVEKCAKKKVKKDDGTLESPEPSLKRALAKTFWKDLTYLGILSAFNELFVRLAMPVLLGRLLEYFAPNSTVTHSAALYYAIGIILLSGGTVFAMNHYMVGCFHMGMRARIAVCSLIYRKSLKLSRTALGESAPGKVVNLLSNDVNRFDIVSVFLHYLWIAPVAALLVLYFLFDVVGVSGVLGIGVVFTVMPIQAYAGKLSSKFRLQTAMKTDERVRLMGEIISGVQVIKMYAWEKPFQALITLARKLEIKVIRKTSYVRAIYMTFLMTTTRIAVYSCMILMYYLGEELTAAKMFVVATYFNILSSTMSSMFVRAIAEVAEFLVAIKRLQKFLQQDEFITTEMANIKSKADQNNINNAEPMAEENDNSNKSIKIFKAQSKWVPESKFLTLDIDEMNITKGKLIGVIGPIGCGKSSLLQLILGELPMICGNLEVNGTLSYACQEPWVFGASVRQNILFGMPFEKNRYNAVVRVCALLKDFEQFTKGDQTIIGERGTSLSGGQKARINLARAVYRQADIFLLDDPLSAVDSHVGRHLYDQCIKHYLRGKTRILVTHQLHYLKDADHIILLKDGKIEMQGSYHDMINSSLEFTKMLAPMEEENNSEVGDEYKNPRERIHSNSRKLNSRKNSAVSQRTQRSGSVTSSLELDCLNISGVEDDAANPSEKQETMQVESSSKKVVQGSVGFGYLKAGVNYAVLCLLFAFFLISQTFASAADFWMSFWTSQEELRLVYGAKDMNVTNASDSYTVVTERLTDYGDLEEIRSNATVAALTPQDDLLSSEACVLIYTGIIVLLIVTTTIRSVSFYNVCMSASQKLHDLMFRGIVRSPLRFFHTNPSGRIMNRFSKDMGAVDEMLPKAILDSTQMILQMFGAIILASYVNPYFLVPIAVLVIIFILIRKLYLKTSKNVKRLEGMARSPVFTHLNATLQGLSTIRAYKAQTILKSEFDLYQDTHTSAHFLFITTSSAFGLLLDILCLALVAIVTLSFLFVTIDLFGDKVGLAITQVMSLTFLMQWGIRQSAEVANQLMAVERVLEYIQIPAEKGIAPDELDMKSKTFVQENYKKAKTPPRGWPEEGHIQIKDLYMKYSEDPVDPHVLKGLNCVFYPTEKIGIVGRTGAGKSSIISAMFRLAYNEGAILIDGVNTEEISLEDLRKKISIIPQDPVLFSGTLRRNLDPFEEYSDSALWRALDEVELKDAITGPLGLESKVMDEGSNFSVGQRQLICLARAILRNNRILMLDEATANVDPYTDNLIQRTIREKFADCTVLTIAHRLNTIMDSDKVLVMDHAEIVEYNHPHVLLNNPEGYLHKMSQETGKQNFEVLRESALESFNKKRLHNEAENIQMIDD